MSFFSHRLLAVKPSPTLAATQKANELKAQGHKILSLSAGEPDFDTPAWICEAAVDALQQGQTRYTAVGGTPALKAAIIAKFKTQNDLDYTPDQIIASTGGKQVIFNALLATLNPGDEVILPAPYWVSYADIVTIAGGNSIMVPCPADQQFKLTPSQLAAALTPQTKWLILNSPSNPTGSVYTKAELQGLADILLDHPSVMILSDDIYEHILFTGDRFWTLAQVEPRLKERVLTMNGVSKSYAMTGWRLGYAGGPASLIRVMTDLQSHSTSNPSSITQAAAVKALMGPQEFLTSWNESFQTRRDLVLQGLADVPGLTCTSPDGAFYVYPSCAGAIGKMTPNGTVLDTDEDITTYLLESVGVSVVPGVAFGLSPYFRISYATDETTLTQACALIRQAFMALV